MTRQTPRFDTISMPARPEIRRKRAATIVLVVALVGGAIGLAAGGASACDLMGFSFNKEVEAHELFDRFRELSARNRDGWGVGFYTDASPTVFKEPIPVAESRLAEALIANRLIRSKIFILHLRAASIGKPSQRNTHPWVREVDGTEYTLAHVGGADKRLWQAVELGRFKPVGENCAEYMFCHMVAEIEKQGVTAWDRDAFDGLHRVVQAVNEAQTTSHLLSDGTHLFAYSSTRTSWLAYARREMPPAGSESGAEPAVGFVVARNGHNLTEPGEPWTKIPPGHLVVFKEGAVVYRSDASEKTEL